MLFRYPESGRGLMTELRISRNDCSRPGQRKDQKDTRFPRGDGGGGSGGLWRGCVIKTNRL